MEDTPSPAPTSTRDVPAFRFARLEIEQRPAARTAAKVEADGRDVKIRSTIELPTRWLAVIAMPTLMAIGAIGNEAVHARNDPRPATQCEARADVNLDKVLQLIERVRELERDRVAARATAPKADTDTKEAALREEAQAKEIARLHNSLGAAVFKCQKELRAQGERIAGIEAAAAQKSQEERINALILAYEKDPRALTREALEKAFQPTSGPLKAKVAPPGE